MVKYKVMLTNSFQTGCQKFQSTRKMLLPGISRELHGTQPSISSRLCWIWLLVAVVRLRWTQSRPWHSRNLNEPAQSGKVASNSLDWCNGSLYPCCPSCPPYDGITFPKHDRCVDEKCMLTIECQGLDCVHRSRTTFVLEDSNATLLHQSWPLLVQETEPWKQRITCDELSKIQKANNFAKASTFIHEVSSEIHSVVLFSVKFQDVLRRKALKPRLVCKQP